MKADYYKDSVLVGQIDVPKNTFEQSRYFKVMENRAEKVTKILQAIHPNARTWGLSFTERKVFTESK